MHNELFLIHCDSSQGDYVNITAVITRWKPTFVVWFDCILKKSVHAHKLTNELCCTLSLSKRLSLEGSIFQ